MDTVLEAETIRGARKNAKIRQDRKRFARAEGVTANVDEAQERYEAVKSEVFLTEDGTVVIDADFDDEYDAILAAHLRAASQRLGA